jgi:hypothetical protein
LQPRDRVPNDTFRLVQSRGGVSLKSDHRRPELLQGINGMDAYVTRHASPLLAIQVSLCGLSLPYKVTVIPISSGDEALDRADCGLKLLGELLVLLVSPRFAQAVQFGIHV